MMSDEMMAETAASSEAGTAPAVLASEGAPVVEAKAETPAGPKPGMRIEGKVRSIVAFGAFVDIGAGRDGLAHISTLQRAGIDKTLKVGDAIEVQVRAIDAATNRISLTVAAAERGPKTALTDLEIGSTVTGRVVRLAEFGAFVDIGAQSDALLHVSQLGRGFTARPSDVLKAGDEVQVRILGVDTERRRISLTMKGGDEEPARPARAPVVAEPAAAPSAADEEEAVPGTFASAWEEALSQRRARRRRPGA